MDEIIIYKYETHQINKFDYDGLKYVINLVNKLVNKFIISLKSAITLFRFPGCYENIEKFKNNQTNLMNIPDLFTKLLSITNSTPEAELSIIKYNLKSYSSLLNYICALLYLRSTNNSFKYLLELIEYGAIFDTIHRFINKTNDEDSFKFVIKELHYYRDEYLIDELKITNVDQLKLSNNNNVLVNLVITLRNYTLFCILNDIPKKTTNENKYEYKKNICDILLTNSDIQIVAPAAPPAAAAPVVAAPPAATLQLSEHTIIHEIYNLNDVKKLYNNKNILIIKYGAEGCLPCEEMDKPFKSLAESNTKEHYRYCKITFITKSYKSNKFDELIKAGIMQKGVAYPFIKIYKDNLLYSINNNYSSDDDVKHYIDELKKLLINDFFSLNLLEHIQVNLKQPPAQPQALPVSLPPAAPAAPAPAAPAIPAISEEIYEQGYNIKIVHNILVINDLKNMINKFLVVIINFYNSTDESTTQLNSTYIAKANNNTDNNIIFSSVNIKPGLDTKLNNFITKVLLIDIFPTIVIYYKHNYTPVLMFNNDIVKDINTELNTILAKLKYNLNNVNHIFSMEMLKTFFNDDFDKIIVKFTNSSGACGACNTLQPIYEDIASKNTNTKYRYTEIDTEHIYGDDSDAFMTEYDMRTTPKVIIFNREGIIERSFDGVSEGMINYLNSLVSDASIGGGANKYKKTDKQITVIYKKKQYTRIIYICERKKYVKINKTYILLSKLKKV
jgi:hypothetical protein